MIRFWRGGDSVRADRNDHARRAAKEVTVIRRVTIVTLVVVACLVVAVPAMAFNGMRSDYTTSTTCKVCHDGSFPSVPVVYGAWAETKHAEANGDDQSERLPYGSVCAGCHTANYDPSKVVPTPTATAGPTDPTPGAVTWIAGNMDPDPAAQATGTSAASELDVGCSSCHQSQDAAHRAPFANLANAEICGQCHTRYSYTVDTYMVAPFPYANVDASGSPVPNTKPTTLIQPQMALGFTTMGNSAGSWAPPLLATALNVPSPSWTPTPNPSATSAGFGRLQTYWMLGDEVLPWSQTGHDGNAQQYAEWAGPADLHAQALVNLKKVMGSNPPAQCLECHSADYIIAPDDAKPTGAQTKYGITCVAFHTPHE